VITIDIKAQKKYCTLKVALVLNDSHMKLLNRVDWAVPLDEMLVRWFSGTWNLQQRKEHEKFYPISQITLKQKPYLWMPSPINP
jgi:hypothetical protein